MVGINFHVDISVMEMAISYVLYCRVGTMNRKSDTILGKIFQSIGFPIAYTQQIYLQKKQLQLLSNMTNGNHSFFICQNWRRTLLMNLIRCKRLPMKLINSITLGAPVVERTLLWFRS